ncbi:DNA primase family protein [Solibacillus silvestris]|uniref:DNA primase family protein n=1 Tax=Solibacillus silvestris TaxID=76853 RepID=UPI003F81B27D
MDFNYFEAYNRKTKRYKEVISTWDAFVERLREPHVSTETYAEYMALPKSQQDDLKDKGAYFLGTLKNGMRSKETVVNRFAVTLDIDHADSSLNWSDVQAALPFTLVMHSTRKHSAESPRYRIIIPLDRKVGYVEYNAVARLLGGKIGIEYVDDTTFQFERMMYYPTVSKDAEYIFEVQELQVLNADEFLAEHVGWQKTENLPYSERGREHLNHRMEMKKAGDPLTKPGAVGLFNRTYSIHDAIETFLPDVYEYVGDERYTYLGGSTTGGVLIYDNIFTYSHHSTDPCSQKLCNAFDLVRIHYFGEYDDSDEKNILKLASYTEMVKLVAKDEKCKVQERADAMAICIEDFEDEVDTELAETVERSKELDIDLSDAFFGKHGFNPVKLARAINEITPVICVDGVLYVYDRGVYKADRERKIRRYAANILGERYRSSHGNEVVEVLKDLNTVTSMELEKPRTDVINLKNGLYEIRTGKLLPHTKDFVSFAQIPVAYDAKAKCPTIDKFIKDVVPADSVNMIYEIFGLCLIPQTFSAAFFFLGEGRNGKSTMIELLTAFVGEDNVSNVTLQDLSANRFKLAQLQHKLVNAYGDLPSTMLSETDIFKSICTGDKVNAERKGVDAFNFKPYARLVYGMNKMPATRDFSNGFTRRLKIIEFNKPVKNPDVKLIEKMTTASELSGLLNKALKGLERLLERGCFENNESTKAALASYVSVNDPLESFIEEHCLRGDGFRVSCKDFNNRYISYLHEQHFTRIPNSNQVKTDMQSKGFKASRVYGDTRQSYQGLSLNEDFDDLLL